MRARVTSKDGETTEIEASEATIADLAADPELKVEVLPTNETTVARPWVCGDSTKPTAQG